MYAAQFKIPLAFSLFFEYTYVWSVVLGRLSFHHTVLRRLVKNRFEVRSAKLGTEGNSEEPKFWSYRLLHILSMTWTSYYFCYHKLHICSVSIYLYLYILRNNYSYLFKVICTIRDIFIAILYLLMLVLIRFQCWIRLYLFVLLIQNIEDVGHISINYPLVLYYFLILFWTIRSVMSYFVHLAFKANILHLWASMSAGMNLRLLKSGSIIDGSVT